MEGLLDDTKSANAMIYLGENLKIFERDAWLEELIIAMNDGYAGYMFYVGPGYVKLTVAVIAGSEEDAESIMEEHLRCGGRAGEIGEDEVYQDALHRCLDEFMMLEENYQEGVLSKELFVEKKSLIDWPEVEYECFCQKIPKPRAVLP